MNKQIEEMARDIRIVETEYLVAMVTADIDDAIDGAAPRDERIATALYEKGYRKTSAVAREIFAEIEALIYSKCFSIRADRDVTGLIIDGEHFSELKKKYESEGA